MARRLTLKAIDDASEILNDYEEKQDNETGLHVKAALVFDEWLAMCDEQQDIVPFPIAKFDIEERIMKKHGLHVDGGNIQAFFAELFNKCGNSMKVDPYSIVSVVGRKYKTAILGW